MGVFRDPITINNVGAVGSTTNPLTGPALGMDRENQKAIKELIGTLDWESLSILDGGITPVSSEIIVDTEDGTPADDLTTINLTSDGTTSLHTGMRIKIKSADPSRVITVKHLTGGGNIRTADGQDVVLSNDWSLDLKLQNGEWVEQKGRGYAMATEALGQLQVQGAALGQVTESLGQVTESLGQVTESLGEVQVQGAASWSADGAPYPVNAQVYHNSKQWLALRANSVEPTEGDDWTELVGKQYVDANLPDLTGYLQPSMTGSATLNGTTNNTVQLTGIVTTLGLEVGDVIRIQYSGYNKLHSVESITDNDLIIVNYEHAGNRADGSLKLPNTTTTATITRIAKWYNAPIGLGQAWVNVTASRAKNITYTNNTGRPIYIFVAVEFVADKGGLPGEADYSVGALSFRRSGTLYPNSVDMLQMVIPSGVTCRVYAGTNVIQAWWELR